jgi:putative SOS response-associated peptidase YedK
MPAMCGRYSLVESGEEIAARFLLDAVPGALHPRYNIAPSQAVLIVAGGEGRPRRAELARWGLLPAWAREARLAQINARIETAAERRMFAGALRARRCLVPASSFFEWRRGPGARRPIRFAPAAGGLWAFAGIWEDWAPPGGPGVRTCAILTTAPNALVAPVHDRMPVILPPDLEAAWMAPGPLPADVLAGAARPYPAERMTLHAVSTAVNDARRDAPDCIAPIS